ncbi:MAG TPA: RNA polymerase sigma factor [Gaiellaceae bacterium]|nr:RNA polymerase sigma factor [Gaiellaceae bacterium]
MTIMGDRRLDQIETLYRTRFPYYARVARGIIGDRERAVEAVQDAFVGLVRSRQSFRGDGPFEAWVWRAVVNAARKATQRPLIEVGGIEDARYFTPDGVSELAPLIAQLPQRQRLVVFLRYYADLDYCTIAAILEVEVGTVSATLAAAHSALRHKLGEVKTYG